MLAISAAGAVNHENVLYPKSSFIPFATHCQNDSAERCATPIVVPAQAGTHGAYASVRSTHRARALLGTTFLSLWISRFRGDDTERRRGN
jgi:hypothetical protein